MPVFDNPAAGSRSPATDTQPADGGAERFLLETFLSYRLATLSETVARAMARIYGARFGLAIPEWRVLATLGQYPGITAKAIAEHGHMHKTMVSRAVASLEERGLVARRTNPEDMRAAFLALTPEGANVYAELVPAARRFDAALQGALGPEERAQFMRVLDHLMTNAEALDAAGARLEGES